MGRNYVAWAVLRGNDDSGYCLHRHGTIRMPDVGDTLHFAQSVRWWAHFIEWFIMRDVQPIAWAVERFTYRPGSQGQASEEINLHIAGLMPGAGAFAVRNTDWKRWFFANVAESTQAFFRTPTEHEADAAGIAMYLGCVLLPRVRGNPSPAEG